jgi:hypothetical protein
MDASDSDYDILPGQNGREIALGRKSWLLTMTPWAAAEDVGRFRNDWTGNSIVVERVAVVNR